MKVEQLIEVMKYHLNNFNDEHVEINNDTIHEAVLSDSDGYGTANSKPIYRSYIRWTLKKNGHEDKNWPVNWMKLTVSELAIKII